MITQPSYNFNRCFAEPLLKVVGVFTFYCFMRMQALIHVQNQIVDIANLRFKKEA